MRRPIFMVVFCGLLVACGGGGGGGGAPGQAATGATGPGSGAGTLAPTRPCNAQLIDTEGEGFLTLQDGKPVLHLKGSSYQRGVQYGALVGNRVEGVVGLLPAIARYERLPAWIMPAVVTVTASLFRPYYPPEVRDMIRGIVDGNRARRPRGFLAEDDLLFLSALVDLGAVFGDILNCSSIAAWGQHTVGGKMLQTRNVDLFIGLGLEDFTLVALEKGAGKIPFANLGWCGMLGVMSGLNAHGVGVGQVWAESLDKTVGMPWSLTVRRIMEEAVGADDAVRIFSAEPERTYGCNFVFADRGDATGGTPRAFAVESSPRYLSIFTDDDPREDLAVWQGPGGPEPYAIRVPEAVFRADTAMDPLLRSRQTAAHGPNGDPRTSGAYRNRYQGQIDSLRRRTQNGAAPIDAQGMIGLTQDVAMRGSSLQCCVYQNTDLEVWVADAVKIGPQQGADASTQPYVHHDLNFYLPTVFLELDRSAYAAGDTPEVTLTWSSLGTGRDLELELRVEAGTTAYAFPNEPARIPLSFREGAAPATRVLRLALPVLPAGACRVVGRLYERGTTDLVDLAVALFDAR